MRIFRRLEHIQRGSRGKRKEERYDWEPTRWFGSAGRGPGGWFDRHDGCRKPWDVIPAPQRRFWSSRFWPLPSLRRSCSTPCSWWDREKSQGAEPKAALSRNVVGQRRRNRNPSPIVTRMLEYWGISDIPGQTDQGQPSSCRMRVYDYECSSIINDASNDASSR